MVNRELKGSLIVTIVSSLILFGLVVFDILDKKRDLPILLQEDFWWLEGLWLFASIIFGFIFFLGMMSVIIYIQGPYFFFPSEKQIEEEKGGDGEEGAV